METASIFTATDAPRPLHDQLASNLKPQSRRSAATTKEQQHPTPLINQPAFAAYQGPLGYEIHDLTITLDDDMAFGHSLNRISGTLKNGNKAGLSPLDFSQRYIKA